MIHIIFILIKPFSDPSCPMDGGIDSQETTTIRIEMFHHRIKVIAQNNFVLICSDPSLKGDKWIQTMPAKCPPQHSRATGSPHCRGQAFRPVPFFPLICHPSVARLMSSQVIFYLYMPISQISNLPREALSFILFHVMEQDFTIKVPLIMNSMS